jgi:DNA-binding transcriptional LysR family regulator
MELRQLETFRIVMATRNMTSAAKQVYLSPAAVSLQLKNLSDELGTELFARVGRQLIPTPAAMLLEQHLGRLMEVLQTIRQDFPSDSECDTRPFVLATGLTTLIYQLRKPLAELRKKFPRNDIQVRIGTTEEIISQLEHREADLGIVSLPVSAPNIQLVPLFREEMLFLVSARLRKNYRATVNLKELAGVPMILYPSGTNMRSIIDRMLQNQGVTLRVTMELDNTEAIKKLVEAGFGASILPEKALSKSPLLRTLRIQGEHAGREVALAISQTARPRKLTAVISNHLIEKLRRVAKQR